MRHLIRSTLLAATLVGFASAAMAAPSMAHHYKYPYGYGTSSDRAWQWWHNEADHE